MLSVRPNQSEARAYLDGLPVSALRGGKDCTSIHGTIQWDWTQDARCYYLADKARLDPMPTAFCLGDRMVHATYGKDSYGVCWVGSTSDNWHGLHFGYDLGDAIRWVQEANHHQLGTFFWSKKSLELTIPT